MSDPHAPKLKVFSNQELAWRLAGRPSGYAAELEAAIVRRLASGIVVDVHSPAWRSMRARYKPARLEESRRSAQAAEACASCPRLACDLRGLSPCQRRGRLVAGFLCPVGGAGTSR